MPTMVYRCADGKRVPSVTTITGRFKDSGGLIHWAGMLAFEPLQQARVILSRAITDRDGWRQAAIDFNSIAEERFDFRAAREKAADAGTIAHEMVDNWLHKKEFDSGKYEPALVEMAKPAYQAFREWADQSKLEVTETEKPLVSERYRFGGTRDAIFVNGKRALGDWKSSNAIYPEYLVQLAAYGILDEEHGQTIDGGYHLCRFSKQEKPTDPVQFTHYYWSHLEPAKRAFVLLREAYDLMAELGKLAK
jgi:hypothetical protein